MLINLPRQTRKLVPLRSRIRSMLQCSRNLQPLNRVYRQQNLYCSLGMLKKSNAFHLEALRPRGDKQATISRTVVPISTLWRCWSMWTRNAVHQPVHPRSLCRSRSSDRRRRRIASLAEHRLHHLSNILSLTTRRRWRRQTKMRKSKKGLDNSCLYFFHKGIIYSR